MNRLGVNRRLAADVTGENLREQVHFCAESGQIWLHEHRMLLIHAEAQGALRKELIESLGIKRTQGLFARMGYASGGRDAELASCAIARNASDRDAFMTGPLLHMLEGVVKVTPIKLDLERASAKFYGEFLWENSWEGRWHRHHYGVNSEPVCWSLIGYACGYTSAFMGRPILYKEVECAGMGHRNCRIVGKPVEEWEDASEYARFFEREPIADRLVDLQTQVVQLRPSTGEAPADMLGHSAGFRSAYELLMQAAGSKITVLLQGETGVGKELFARALHDRSRRSNGPFVAVNCAAIPLDLVESELFGAEKGAYTGALISRPGRFERADGGTLLLDEVGDLPLSAQAKLLRVLQEGELERLGGGKSRKVDVRLVAATNCDLRKLVREGRFRSDLYYRLNAYEITIPPLRDRNEDIPVLARSFLEKFCAANGKQLRGFTDKAKRALLAYHWPGNIRELQNTIERGVILAQNGGRVEVNHLFMSFDADHLRELGMDVNGSLDLKRSESTKALCDAVLNGPLTLDGVEGLLIENAVDRARGNLSSAARSLGLTRAQLAYRLKRLHEGEEIGTTVDTGPSVVRPD